MSDVEEGLKQMQKTGKIDRIKFNNPGMLIDLHNHRLQLSQEKDHDRLMHNMNEYYLKLIIDTMEQKASGVVNPIYKSKLVSLSIPDTKTIIVPPSASINT